MEEKQSQNDSHVHNDYYLMFDIILELTNRCIFFYGLTTGVKPMTFQLP